MSARTSPIDTGANEHRQRIDSKHKERERDGDASKGDCRWHRSACATLQRCVDTFVAGVNVVPLLTLALVTFALGFGELMIAGILPAIAADTRVSIPLTGQLVTVYALVFALLSPPLALVLRTSAAKRVLIASVLIVPAANAAAAVSAGFTLLVSARIVAAVGSAVATPLALAAVDRVATADFRGRAHGIVFTGFSLAAMLGVPLGTLVATRYGWHATFGCVAVLNACAAAFIARSIPRSVAAAHLGWSALTTIVVRPRVRQALSVSALFLTAQYTAFTYFRPYFEFAGGDSVAIIIMLFFVFGVFGIIGTLLGGVLVDRHGPRLTLLLSVGGCGLVLAALPLLAHSVLGSIAAIAGWALTSWAFSPAVNRQLGIAAGDATDIALALNLTAFNIGIALGSALGGVTIALAGIARLPLAAAALVAIAWLVALPVPQLTSERVDGGDQREIAR